MHKPSTLFPQQAPRPVAQPVPRATHRLLHPSELEWYVQGNHPSQPSHPDVPCQQAAWTSCWRMSLCHNLQMLLLLMITFCLSSFPPTALSTLISSYDPSILIKAIIRKKKQ